MYPESFKEGTCWKEHRRKESGRYRAFLAAVAIVKASLTGTASHGCPKTVL